MYIEDKKFVHHDILHLVKNIGVNLVRGLSAYMNYLLISPLIEARFGDVHFHSFLFKAYNPDKSLQYKTCYCGFSPLSIIIHIFI